MNFIFNEMKAISHTILQFFQNLLHMAAHLESKHLYSVFGICCVCVDPHCGFR